MCVVGLGMFLSQGLLYPAIPLYPTDELGTSKATAGLVASSLSIAAIAGRPLAGWFIDARGRKPLIVAGPVIIAASALGLLATSTVGAALALRFMQGFGTPMFYGGANATVADIAPVERRARFLAGFSLFFYLGFAAGPALAEYLIARQGFEAVWVAVAVSAGVGAVLAALVLPETRDAQAAAARPPGGRIPLWQRFFHPAAIGPGAVYFSIAISFTSVTTFLALYAREIGMASSERLFLTLSATVVATRLATGGLADRFGRLAVAVPAALSVAAGLGVLAAAPNPTGAFVGVVLFGAGYAGAFPTLLAMVVDRAPEAERGQAMSSFTLFFDLGSPLGGLVVGRLIDVGGFGLGYAVAGTVSACGGIAMLAHAARRRVGAVQPRAAR